MKKYSRYSQYLLDTLGERIHTRPRAAEDFCWQSTRVSRNTVYHSGYFCVNTYSHLGRMLKIHEYYSCTLYSLYTSNNQRYTRKYSCITRVYLEVLVYLRKGRAAAAPRRGLQIGVELIASASSPPLSLQKIFAISVQCCSLVFG